MVGLAGRLRLKWCNDSIGVTGRWSVVKTVELPCGDVGPSLLGRFAGTRLAMWLGPEGDHRGA